MTDYCTKYQDDLKAFVDGELSWLRRTAIRRHLTHCASCREEIIAMTQISDDLRSSEPEEVLPPSLREKILADVPLAPNNGGTGEEKTAKSGSPIIGGGGGLRNRRVPAWTFAAIALVAWFIFYPLYQKVREQAAITGVSESLANPLPVRVAKTGSAAPIGAFEQAGSPVSAALPEPVRAKVPPPPPKMRPAPPEAEYAPRAVNVASAPLPHVIAPSGISGSAASDSLNADPDSLRQVHKEASIGLQVPNPEATGDTLNQMVQETGGYVAANNLSTDPDGMRSGELIVKVPEPQFETFLAAVAKLGVVVSKNITGQDITEKTSDAHEAQDVEESDLTQAEARLKALGSHAKWEDTQNAEDLRVQLAQTRARLKLLKRMAALGTVTIDLNQTPKAAAALPVTNGFIGTLKATTHDALQSLVGSAAALLALIIWLLAYAPIWVPLLLLGRYALKEYKKRETA